MNRSSWWGEEGQEHSRGRKQHINKCRSCKAMVCSASNKGRASQEDWQVGLRARQGQPTEGQHQESTPQKIFNQMHHIIRSVVIPTDVNGERDLIQCVHNRVRYAM